MRRFTQFLLLACAAVAWSANGNGNGGNSGNSGSGSGKVSKDLLTVNPTAELDVIIRFNGKVNPGVLNHLGLKGADHKADLDKIGSGLFRIPG